MESNHKKAFLTKIFQNISKVHKELVRQKIKSAIRVHHTIAPTISNNSYKKAKPGDTKRSTETITPDNCILDGLEIRSLTIVNISCPPTERSESHFLLVYFS